MDMNWYVPGEGWRRRSVLRSNLLDRNGQEVSLNTYRERQNLVLLFLHDTMCSRCVAALRQFARIYPAFVAQEGRLIAIFASSVEAVRDLQTTERFPFELFADPSRQVRHAYASLLPDPNDQGVIALVLDRFGGLYAIATEEEPDDPQLPQESVQWLAFIEIQCPECGIPEWLPEPYS